MDKYRNVKDRNIIIVYLKDDLKFESLVSGMKEYVLKTYGYEEKGVESQRKILDSVSNLKNLFEQVYKAGMILYSSVHGEVEVDVMINALRPYVIRTGYISGSKDKAVVPISNKDIDEITSIRKKEFTTDELMKEVEQYLEEQRGNNKSEK